MIGSVRLLRWPERDQRDFDHFTGRLNEIRSIAEARRDGPDAEPSDYRVPVPNPPEHPSHMEKAQALYAHRRDRVKVFGAVATMFQEPVWDIVLDLFIAHEKGIKISVGSACVAAYVPYTTALRWIRSMEQAEMVRCWPSESDKRVRYITLSEPMVAMMLRYLDTV